MNTKTTNETNLTNEYTMAMEQSMRKHLDGWQNGIERLEDELTHFTKEIQMTYREQIDQLKRQLHELKTRHKAMVEGGDDELLKGQSLFQQRLTAFRESFLENARRIADEDEKVPLGWLQGFTEERTQESEGWAEGLGKRAQGSEGWAEGMGDQGDESKGWVEGYKNN
jgi:hypothetical protein